MSNQLTDPTAIKTTLEGLYRDRERLNQEVQNGWATEADLRSVEENITILEAQLRAKDASAHHHHYSESESP